jgi:hypothetical protein
VKVFKYLGFEISYEYGRDIQQKLAKVVQVWEFHTTFLD